VSPINVPTMESLAAYRQRYPAGPGQPYPTLANMLAKATSMALASLTASPSPGPTALPSNSPEDGDGASEDTKTFYSSHTLYVSAVTAAVFGAAVGACITLLLLRGGLSRHDTYLPIR